MRRAAGLFARCLETAGGGPEKTLVSQKAVDSAGDPVAAAGNKSGDKQEPGQELGFDQVLDRLRQVVLRLEQLGIHSFAQLATEDAGVLAQRVAALVGGSCWRNSPMATWAIVNASAAFTPISGYAAACAALPW